MWGYDWDAGYSHDIYEISNILNDYVFISKGKSGKERNSIFVTQDNNSSSNRVDYNKLFFNPEVSLEIKSVITGEI